MLNKSYHEAEISLPNLFTCYPISCFLYDEMV